jgi:hypothetical protein
MADFGDLRGVIDSFGFVGAKVVNRFGAALSDAEGNPPAYKFENAISDAFAFYNDVFAAWFGLATGAVVSPTPSVTMQIAQGSATATTTVPLNLPAAITLDKTDLRKIGRPIVPKISKNDVTLTIQNTTDLKIDIQNLANVKAGLFKGLVFNQVTKEPVLEIQLRVV